MSENLPNESKYSYLAEFLRSGGRLEVGENHEFGCFARLLIGRNTLNVAKMIYADLGEVLQVMDGQAKQYIERNR